MAALKLHQCTPAGVSADCRGTPRVISTANDNFRPFAGQFRFDSIPSAGIDIASGCGVFQRGNGFSRPVDVGAAPNQFGTLDLGPNESRPTSGF